MQNGTIEGEIFRLAVLEVRKNAKDGKATKTAVHFFLLAAGRQYRVKKAYHYANLCEKVARVVKASDSLKLAYDELTTVCVRRHQPPQLTPDSNTGVTETGAAVPLDYFTRGKV